MNWKIAVALLIIAAMLSSPATVFAGPSDGSIHGTSEKEGNISSASANAGVPPGGPPIVPPLFPPPFPPAPPEKPYITDGHVYDWSYGDHVGGKVDVGNPYRINFTVVDPKYHVFYENWGLVQGLGITDSPDADRCLMVLVDAWNMEAQARGDDPQPNTHMTFAWIGQAPSYYTTPTGDQVLLGGASAFEQIYPRYKCGNDTEIEMLPNDCSVRLIRKDGDARYWEFSFAFLPREQTRFCWWNMTVTIITEIPRARYLDDYQAQLGPFWYIPFLLDAAGHASGDPDNGAVWFRSVLYAGEDDINSTQSQGAYVYTSPEIFGRYWDKDSNGRDVFNSGTSQPYYVYGPWGYYRYTEIFVHGNKTASARGKPGDSVNTNALDVTYGSNYWYNINLNLTGDLWDDNVMNKIGGSNVSWYWNDTDENQPLVDKYDGTFEEGGSYENVFYKQAPGNSTREEAQVHYNIHIPNVPAGSYSATIEYIVEQDLWNPYLQDNGIEPHP